MARHRERPDIILREEAAPRDCSAQPLRSEPLLVACVTAEGAHESGVRRGDAVRKPSSWLRSQQHFYCCYARGCRKWLAPWRRGSNLVYGTECPSREQAIKRYVQHNRNVFDAVPRDRLLVMDIAAGDGWDQLCAFLGLPRPPRNVSFPSRH